MVHITDALYDLAAVDLSERCGSAYSGRLVIQGFDRAGNDFDTGNYRVDFDLRERAEGELELIIHGISPVSEEYAHPNSPAYGGAWLRYADHSDIHTEPVSLERIVDIQRDRTYRIRLIDEPSGTTKDYVLTRQDDELVIEPA
jgi:hypothetical protein